MTGVFTSECASDTSECGPDNSALEERRGELVAVKSGR